MERSIHVVVQDFYKHVASYDGASKLCYTIIYGLYHGLNLDYGSFLCTQIIQSTTSTTCNTENSYVCFWSIVVKIALVDFKVPVMDDFVVVAIPIL